MKLPSKEQIAELNSQYKGKRIKLLSMEDPQAPPMGTIGTCWMVDDAGSLLMEWDNGSGLNLIPNVDSFQIVSEEK